MLIKEFRVTLPLTVDEYQVGQLYSVAEMSKSETGGGEGIEVMKNEPFNGVPLLGGRYNSGQYTYKVYHLSSKVPSFIRLLAPKGALEIHEEAWNAYPYCKTVISNPDYMKDAFYISIETMHLPDRGNTDNAHFLPADKLKQREVIFIDIANDPVTAGDYKEMYDPKICRSSKTNRGPLQGNWMDTCEPVMCCYKLVTCQFKWFGLQSKVETIIQKTERRLFANFHRQVFCTLDQWSNLTMADIRRLEEQTKRDLEQKIRQGTVQGAKVDE